MTRARAAVLLLAGIAGCGGSGNGSGPWRPFTIPNTFDVAALWAFAPNDVWAGGDCAQGGQDLTVAAVDDGRRAAEAIHRFLSA